MELHVTTNLPTCDPPLQANTTLTAQRGVCINTIFHYALTTVLQDTSRVVFVGPALQATLNQVQEPVNQVNDCKKHVQRLSTP